MEHWREMGLGIPWNNSHIGVKWVYVFPEIIHILA